MRRVLLDEHLPRPLQKDLPDFEVRTVGEAGWKGIQNGELLKRAAAEFDVLLTADRNIPHQQNLQRFQIGLVVLALGSIKLHVLREHAAAISAALAAVSPGTILYVTPDDA